MTTLLESKSKPFGSSKGVVVSMILHATIIAAAVFGTARVILPPREKVEEHPILYVASPPPPPIQAAPEPLPKVNTPPRSKAVFKAPPAPRREAMPRPTPVPVPSKVPTTPALVAPTKVALALPEIDPRAAATVSDVVAPPISEAAKGTGLSSGGLSKKGGDDGEAGGKGLSSGGSGKAYDENQVDRAVEVTRNSPPRYPDALKSVGVQGIVAMRFIVGADGRVESGSIEVISSPNKLFSDAVRNALLLTRYRAAEAGGNKVRQLVEQQFAFRLDNK